MIACSCNLKDFSTHIAVEVVSYDASLLIMREHSARKLSKRVVVKTAFWNASLGQISTHIEVTLAFCWLAHVKDISMYRN